MRIIGMIKLAAIATAITGAVLLGASTANADTTSGADASTPAAAPTPTPTASPNTNPWD